jgi:hypothetical protein
MNPLAMVVAAFALGAAATWWAESAVARRRMPAQYTDTQLRDRVHGLLASVVSYPGAIGVTVRAGVVHLSGKVREREVQALLMRVKDLQGVRMIHNALSPVGDSWPVEAAHRDPAGLQP